MSQHVAIKVLLYFNLTLHFLRVHSIFLIAIIDNCLILSFVCVQADNEQSSLGDVEELRVSVSSLPPVRPPSTLEADRTALREEIQVTLNY